MEQKLREQILKGNPNNIRRHRVVVDNPENEIVIGGVAGHFPNSENIAEFRHHLYNKIDMVSPIETSWSGFTHEIPQRIGKISNLDKFDATFFGVHYKQAHVMDPQCRMLIEKAFESILDAGINPSSLRGSCTGVYVGACFCESEKTWVYEKLDSGGFGITGCARAMLANRVSYCLGLEGPSIVVDTACSSSMYALDLAFNALRNGEIDSAIVAGTNIILSPYVTLQFVRLGVLADDGYCLPFDDEAHGYTRSETICSIFLQRRKLAIRSYGTLLYSKSNCDGFKQQGITYPSGEVQRRLMEEFYNDLNIDPTTVNYVEAHSTGTKAGDSEECFAIDEIFCKNRKRPLMVGSVKSNVGHTESASGVLSLAKVVLAFETGLIGPNINYKTPKHTVDALVKGRMKVVTDVTPLEGPLVAANSFGFGGANVHCLLLANTKEKVNYGAPADTLPRLVNWSGRTEEALEVFCNDLTSKPLDIEQVALMHNIQKEPIKGYLYRGFALVEHQPNDNAKCIQRETQYYSGTKRPIVWVYSGMGSQWTEMATAMMQIPAFRATIESLHKVLLTKNLDLIKIITDPENKFNNIVHSFVGIAAIQIAITNILRMLDIQADYYVGHSVGELGCAYADGTITPEQMLLAAYSRGMASLETDKIRGAMAAVGLGYQMIKGMVPATIEIACHNGPESCTLSGPEAEIQKFVSELKSKGIFAKEVACSNIAYHSRYIKDMGPNLLKKLREIIPTPKKRSEKWLCSSVPKAMWNREEAKYSSPEYHTNNLLSSVLFEETIASLPSNSVTLEVAPHGLLQAVLKQAMPKAAHVPLTQRGNKTNHYFFLGALGKLFAYGVNMNLLPLYPTIEFPVARGTPMISPLIRWDHSVDWHVTKFEAEAQHFERKTVVTLNDSESDFIEGHTIDGRILYPATGYLLLAWETFALLKEPIYYEVNVEFEDIRFLRATTLQSGTKVELVVRLHLGSGRFEITDGQSVVVTGIVREYDKTVSKEELPAAPKSNVPLLNTRDFYKELRLRGYHYFGAFKNVIEARPDGLYGKIKWDSNNFVPFMDAMLQMQIIGKDSRSLALPTRIRKVRINSQEHIELIKNLDPENSYLEVFANKELETIKSGGIEIIGLTANTVPRRKAPGFPVLESYKFISNLNPPKLPKTEVARLVSQIVLENIPTLQMKIVESDLDNLTPIIDLFKMAIEDLPLVTGDLMLLSPNEITIDNIYVDNAKLSKVTDYLIVIAPRCSARPDVVSEVQKALISNGYLVSREAVFTKNNEYKIPNGFQLISMFQTDDETLVLLQKVHRGITLTTSTVKVSIEDHKFEWLNKLKSLPKTNNIILYSQNEPASGIMGLVNCLRREPDGKFITCVFVDDPSAPPFNPDHGFYKSQLQIGLAINVYRKGQWGTYRHLKLTEDLSEKPQKSHVYGNALSKGDLTSLTWVQGPLRQSANPHGINIQYAALNFRDIMISTGRLTSDIFDLNRIDEECILGLEYSGVTDMGKRVMGFILGGCLASRVIGKPDSYWEVPKTWTMEQAATVPVVYLTVYSAFFRSTQIRKGKSILIHAGTGGVGLAAIRVAIAYGLEVYTTVSTEQKKQFLLKTFPTLKAENIGNSRDTSFERMIRMRTRAKGVDYVLNSLAEDKLTASIRCLGNRGHFLEIGKFDISNDSKIGLGHFLHEISFSVTAVDNLNSADAAETRKVLYDLITRDINSGIIQPLPTTVYNANEIEHAFRFLASAKHIGKVVLRVRDTPDAAVTLPMSVRQRVYFDPELVYVIPGGLGGFGLELVDWMMTRGCKKFVLSSSKGLSRPYQTYRISIWETYGCVVKVNTDDITTKAGCEKLLKDAQSLGHIGGIFNLAVILQDSMMENQTAEKYSKSLGPKAMATIYLDELSRKMCPSLQHFVVFSSVSCGRGNAGQSNYGMANSVMERIIEQRHSQGLPGKAIQWGAVGEVGLVADMAENKIDLEIGGTLQQRISSCLAELDSLLTSDEPIVASMVVAEKRMSSGKRNPIEAVMYIMGIRDIKSVSIESTLSEIGMDSLMAVEINQTLEREFELFLSPQDLRTLTFAKLLEYAEDREKGVGSSSAKLMSENRKIGMEWLIGSIGDESSGTKKYIRLKTLNMSDDSPCNMVIIPGVEGIASYNWDVISGALEMPVFIRQLYDTATCIDIKAVVDRIKDDILTEVVKKSKKFYVVGYSFGSVIALHLVKYLEDRGYSGKLVIIDGSPEFLGHLARGHTAGGKVDDTLIHSVLMTTISKLMFPNENSAELFKLFMSIPTMDRRVDKFFDIAKGEIVYSENYFRTLILAVFNRIKMVLVEFVFPEKLKTQITLIRPTEMSVLEIAEDYDLSLYTEHPVDVHFVEGNHLTILDNRKTAELLNEMYPN